jgi:hypothetical protein
MSGLFDLHMTFVNMCAQDVITHTEHNAFEDVLSDVLTRIEGES